MQEIKFRVWDKELKVMRDARCIDFENSEVSYWLNHETDYSDIVEPFKNVELMQYIGLKDKDGVEIYEGDIIEFLTYDGEIPMAQVVFERFAFKALDIEDECCEYDFDDLMDIEVIGNIYENQELLNENT